MTRWLLTTPLFVALASCATGADEPLAARPSDGSVPVTEGGPADGAEDGAVEDATAEAPEADGSVDDALADGSGTETSVADTATADSPVDTVVADSAVADTYVADTSLADTFVADTYVADTSVADTFVADTSGCAATVVDWNWNTGTGPVSTLTKSGTSWSVGAATAGPSDGQTYLATVPSTIYPNNANDWVRLPTINLAAYSACKIRVTVDLWRNTEKYGLVNYDGGNLQFTTDPAAASGWGVMDGGSMAYDGKLTCTTCLVAGQNVWASSSTPFAKTGTYTSSAPMGSALTLRFTFYSDDGGTLPGIYVKRLRVEAVP